MIAVDAQPEIIGDFFVSRSLADKRLRQPRCGTQGR